MQILNEIQNILDRHECKCYEVKTLEQKLIFIGQTNDCCTLNPAIAEVTGFLLEQGVDYEMDEEHNITLKMLQLIS